MEVRFPHFVDDCLMGGFPAIWIDPVDGRETQRDEELAGSLLGRPSMGFHTQSAVVHLRVTSL